MPDYPIPVARWDDDHPPTLAVCPECGHEATCEDVDDTDGEHAGICTAPNPEDDEGECGGRMLFKFIEVGACPNCGDLLPPHGTRLEGCCSRRCLLAWEHAQRIGPPAAHPDALSAASGPAHPVPQLELSGWERARDGEG